VDWYSLRRRDDAGWCHVVNLLYRQAGLQVRRKKAGGGNESFLLLQKPLIQLLSINL